jgi:hypothetical protein
MQLGINTFYDASQCVEFTSPDAQLTAAWQLTVDPGVQLSLTAECSSYAGVDCTGELLGNSSTTSILGDSGGAWLPIELSVTDRPGRLSVMCGYSVSVPGGDNFSLRIDSAVLTAGSTIFADGFESGNTSAWSETAGGTQ